MPTRTFVLVVAVVLLCAWSAQAQDSQSLGDIARQTRQQKQQPVAQPSAAPASSPSPTDSQAADPNAKPSQPKAAHVYTNDEIPESTPEVSPTSKQPNVQENYKGGKQSAEQWKSQIRQVKANITSIQRQIDSTQSSIRFAGGNYDYHVAYNNRQRAKEQQVENLKSQLAQQQKHLEDLQEAARHQGYSSAVYDP